MDIEAHRRTTGLMMTKGPPTLSLSFDLSSLPLNDLNAEARRRRRHTLLRRWNATRSISHNSTKKEKKKKKIKRTDDDIDVSVMTSFIKR